MIVIAWLIDHMLNIAVLATLAHSILTARRARETRGHAEGLELAVNFLAERAGITPEEIVEDHYRQHPECRPVVQDGAGR